MIVPAPTTCGTPSRNQVLSLRELLFQSKALRGSTGASSRMIDSRHADSAQEARLHDMNVDILVVERSKSRIISNMDELLDALKTLGRVKVFSDTVAMSQAAILSMFSSASVIVGAHGAGLSNMIVSR
jgi:capsular polysaccharide biosynthesis protein